MSNIISSEELIFLQLQKSKKLRGKKREKAVDVLNALLPKELRY